MRVNTSLHADQARRHCGRRNGSCRSTIAATIAADDVKRILANIGALVAVVVIDLLDMAVLH